MSLDVTTQEKLQQYCAERKHIYEYLTQPNRLRMRNNNHKEVLHKFCNNTPYFESEV